LGLIIIEGHKDIDLPGIWLEKGANGKKADKSGCRSRKVVFRDDPEYHQEVLTYIQAELAKFHSERPLMAGLLIGGKSTRMDAHKALLKIKS
jgi:hypothetical protein